MKMNSEKTLQNETRNRFKLIQDTSSLAPSLTEISIFSSNKKQKLKKNHEK